jgi:2-alkenal reductase
VAANGLLAAYEGTLEQVYTQVNQSVVNLQVESSVSGASSRRGSPFGQGVQESLGSGFVWDSQGHIVTNNHVVEGASNISVNFASGATFSAELVGADPNADLAVLKVDAPAEELHPVTLADSTQVKVGQLAIAIGNPYGLSGTMTQGIISALARSLPVGEGNSNQLGGTYSIPDIIQTDAAINPGNSGGVLVDDQGRVIGVTTAIQSATNANSGIGFVIPSAIVNRVVTSIVSTGAYEHPYVGITGVSLTNDLALAMNLEASQKGILIIDVSSGTPAEQAGLRGSRNQTTISGQAVPVGGDVIIAADGQAIRRMEDLTSYLFNNTQVGQTVTLTLLRQGQEQTAEVTLGALPSSTGP